MIIEQSTFERIKQLFDKIDSDELLLLKGHLFIEEFLTRRLEMEFGKETLKALDLSFYKKTVLVGGITNLSKQTRLISTILKINFLRNKFAHELDVTLQKDFIVIIQAAYGEIPKSIKRRSTYLNTVKSIFYLTIGELSGIIEASEVMKVRRKSN